MKLMINLGYHPMEHSDTEIMQLSKYKKYKANSFNITLKNYTLQYII